MTRFFQFLLAWCSFARENWIQSPGPHHRDERDWDLDWRYTSQSTLTRLFFCYLRFGLNHQAHQFQCALIPQLHLLIAATDRVALNISRLPSIWLNRFRSLYTMRILSNFEKYLHVVWVDALPISMKLLLNKESLIGPLWRNVSVGVLWTTIFRVKSQPTMEYSRVLVRREISLVIWSN